MSVLEQIRQAQEEVEIYHEVICDELRRKPQSKRQIIFQDHKLKRLAELASARAALVLELRADKHGMLAKEVAAVKRRDTRFKLFYKQLEDVHKFHTENAALLTAATAGDDGATSSSSDSVSTLSSSSSSSSGATDVRSIPTLMSTGPSSYSSASGTTPSDPLADLGIPMSGAELVEFSGEEFFGRFLDLHVFFAQYTNLPGADISLRYEDYVACFHDLAVFPASTKGQRRYEVYVSGLLSYLEGFLRRTRPMTRHEEWTQEYTRTFEEAWRAGAVPGWKDGVADAEGTGAAAAAAALAAAKQQRLQDKLKLQAAAAAEAARAAAAKARAEAKAKAEAEAKAKAAAEPPKKKKRRSRWDALPADAAAATATTTTVAPAPKPAALKPKPAPKPPPPPPPASAAPVELSIEETIAASTSARQLEELGLEVLKAELTKRGAKCGGSLSDRAARLFLIKSMSPDEIPAKLKAVKSRKRRRRGGGGGGGADGGGGSSCTPAQGTATGGSSSPPSVSASSAHVDVSRAPITLARKEWLIAHRATTSLVMEINDTRRHLELKSTRTHEEMQREMAEEIARDDAHGKQLVALGGPVGSVDGDGNDDEESAEKLYNPKGLPLGYDGKPIPYWLYRLHGLSKSYVCEICGNHTYWGHYDFDKHFNEARHAHGMKCLKIPNTRHFHGITKIADAVALHRKLQKEVETMQWNGADLEEFEDSVGNVMNKASYEDLKKQGLL